MNNFVKTDFGEVLVSGLSFTANVRNNPDKQSSFVSLPVRGDGLVHRASGQHTIQIHTINLNANIAIEGTLDTNPENATWIPTALTNTATGNTTNLLVYTYVPPVPQNPSSGPTQQYNKFFVAQGQYSWLRANISGMTIGIVDLIKLAY